MADNEENREAPRDSDSDSDGDSDGENQDPEGFAGFTPQEAEEAEVNMLLFVREPPIADHFLPRLQLRDIVHLCVVYELVFQYLSVHNEQIKSLFEYIDVTTLYDVTPRTSTLLSVLDRFKPKLLCIGHRTAQDIMQRNILRALRSLNMTEFVIVLRNESQDLISHPVNANQLVIISPLRSTTMLCIRTIFGSMNESLSSLRLVHIQLEAVAIELLRRFRFSLNILVLFNIKIHALANPTRLARHILEFDNLKILHVRCYRTIEDDFLDPFNHILINNIEQLHNLESLELTIVDGDINIQRIARLSKLRKLKLFLEVFCFEDLRYSLQATLARLTHLQRIWIYLFSYRRDDEMLIQQIIFRNHLESLNLSNLTIVNFDFDTNAVYDIIIRRI